MEPFAAVFISLYKSYYKTEWKFLAILSTIILTVIIKKHDSFPPAALMIMFFAFSFWQQEITHYSVSIDIREK